MRLKKWIVLFIGVVLVFNFAACGSSQQAESNTTTDSEKVQVSSVETGTTDHSTDSSLEPDKPEKLQKKTAPE